MPLNFRPMQAPIQLILVIRGVFNIACAVVGAQKSSIVTFLCSHLPGFGKNTFHFLHVYVCTQVSLDARGGVRPLWNWSYR